MQLSDHWKASFRHSAGRLGSAFLNGLAQGRLLGWRPDGAAAVIIPPREFGPGGDWVELSGRATLFASAATPQRQVAGQSDWLAWVGIEGADTPIFAIVRTGGHRLLPGTPLRAALAPGGAPRIETLYFVQDDIAA